MDFPQYRCYQNHQSYFKITAADEFVEYKLTAGKLQSYRFKAKILPDRNFIADMLHHPDPYWEVISEEAFRAFLSRHGH